MQCGNEGAVPGGISTADGFLVILGIKTQGEWIKLMDAYINKAQNRMKPYYRAQEFLLCIYVEQFLGCDISDGVLRRAEKPWSAGLATLGDTDMMCSQEAKAIEAAPSFAVAHNLKLRVALPDEAHTFPLRPKHRFVKRILSEQEQSQFFSKFPQYRPQLEQSGTLPFAQSTVAASADTARWLAGRFAAKEAARKAAPGGASCISWKEVIVRAEPGGNGKPEIVYARNAADHGQIGKLSISHDGDYVVATVMAAYPVG
ncbi:hypothetical protein LOZ66_003019 [Ophidiomyces ophidiicola]|nr:hypothetical protein LOZ66_003019 [Ophidiomyces ophidiicola]